MIHRGLKLMLNPLTIASKKKKKSMTKPLDRELRHKKTCNTRSRQ